MAEVRAYRRLDQLLRSDEAFRKAVRKKIHRVTLSRYRNGHKKPGLSHAVTIERLSDGEIPATSWV